MVEGTEGSHHKEGSKKMSKDSTVCAGIDTGKYKLDVVIDASADRLQVDNSPEGYRSLSAWLRQRGVERIGIEASGGYEQAVVSFLRADGFVVIVFQPVQVRAYAKFVLQHAKNDNIDAALIARCTAAATDIHEPPDTRLAPLAQRLTMIEQLTQDVAQLKTRREACRDQRIREFWKQEIDRLKRLLQAELKQLVAAIGEHRDLATRLDLIASVDGVGLRTAVAILVRMPEIGRVTREQAAAIAGLAPYDDESGQRRGLRQYQRWAPTIAAEPLRGDIAGGLLLECPIESFVQATDHSRKNSQARPRRLRPQAPNLCQHSRRPRDPLDVRASNHIMVAQHEAD